MNRISDPRQTIATIELLPFNSVHCGELLVSKDVNVSEQELQAVMHRTGGLPLFIGLIANYRGLEKTVKGDFSAYFIEEIYLSLNPDERELLLFLCVCNLSRTTLSPNDLVAAEFPYVDAKLAALRKYSAIIWTKSNLGNQIKAHDLIRDIVLRHESSLVSGIAKRVADFFRLQGDASAAVLPALLADDKEQEEAWLEGEVDSASEQKDYPVIINGGKTLQKRPLPRAFLVVPLSFVRNCSLLIFGRCLA